MSEWQPPSELVEQVSEEGFRTYYAQGGDPITGRPWYVEHALAVLRAAVAWRDSDGLPALVPWSEVDAILDREKHTGDALDGLRGEYETLTAAAREAFDLLVAAKIPTGRIVDAAKILGAALRRGEEDPE